MKRKGIDDIVSYAVLLFVPLSVYKLTESGITLGDLALFISFALVLICSFKSQHTIKMAFPLAIYASCIAILSLVHWFFNIESLSVGLLSALRYLFYLSFCIISAGNFFDIKKSFNVYKTLSLVFAIYIFMQFVSYYVFHIVLPTNVLSYLGLKTYEKVYWYNTITRYSAGAVIYRPCSVFLEPAHYAVYQAPMLYMLANNSLNKSPNNRIFAAILAISVLLSGSTVGIVVILYCFGAIIIKALKKNILKSLLIVTGLSILCLAFFNTTYGQKIFIRTFSDGQYGAYNSRYSNVASLSSGDYNKFIGSGMGNDLIGYVPSYYKLIVSFGYFGVVVYLSVVLLTFAQCNKFGKSILGLFLVLSLGTLALFGITSILFFTLIFSNYSKKNYSTEAVITYE